VELRGKQRLGVEEKAERPACRCFPTVEHGELVAEGCCQMKLILLSGGSGKRLWPLSTADHPKQFLQILEGTDGVAVSMLQRVWRQLGHVGLQSQTYICASKTQKEVIQHQLGDISFIEEPEQRDTFPAIALASLYLLDQERCARDEVVTVAPIDHLVDDEYFRELAELERILDASDAEIALMGVKPTEPSSKFGYIELADAQGDRSWFPVTSFVEKPEGEAAAQLIQSGALWNCGVFSFRLGFLLDVLEQNGYPTSYVEAQARFSRFPKRSFDYEVVEHAQAIAVRPYFGAWQDLGTWDVLVKHLIPKNLANGKNKLVDSPHTIILNRLDIPIVAVGLDHLLIVATPEGLLITSKKQG
jgi:mannose-1-phosphate guanylyltransferase